MPAGQYERLSGGNVPPHIESRPAAQPSLHLSSLGGATVGYQSIAPVSRVQTHSHGNQQQQPQADDAAASVAFVSSRTRVVPESAHLLHISDQPRPRWSHVVDLDSFFWRVYQYHQQHGWTCLCVRQLLELAQFVFVVAFSLFLTACVNYDQLFHRSAGGGANKTHLYDVVVPAGQCGANIAGLSPPLLLCVLVAAVFWLLRAVRVCYSIGQMLDIRHFFHTALHVDDSELDNLTWNDIQRRLMTAQTRHHMCIHKPQLTELDIHNRIMRFTNYLVAMVNKRTLPLHFRLPLLGDVVYLSRGLRYNLELLLFWGPGSPFESRWHLQPAYKRPTERASVAATLARRAAWLAVVNLALCPLVLVWQLLYAFYNYAEIVKREPGVLGVRCWSRYGRLFLRHFNELDHELAARLCRGHRAATKYMASFTTPLLEIIAKNVAFVCGAMLAVLLGLTIYDEDVVTVEHMLTLITMLGAAVAVCRSFIADENLVFAPEQLLAAVLAHIHYMPARWRGTAHSSRTVAQFAALFQLKACYLLEELISPLVTPLILMWRIRPASLQLVDFFRHFTVDVVGVGDVCSFAQMDVRRHGHADWACPPSGNSCDSSANDHSSTASPATEPATDLTPASFGKTELSLMHFAINNPQWRPPSDSHAFVTSMRALSCREISQSAAQPNYQPSSAAAAVGQLPPLVASVYDSCSALQHSSLMTSIQQFPGVFDRTAVADTQRHLPAEVSAAEMAISAIYMQEMHRRTLCARRVCPVSVSVLDEREAHFAAAPEPLTTEHNPSFSSAPLQPDRDTPRSSSLC